MATAVGAVALAGAATGIGIGAMGGVWGNVPNMINASRKVRLRTADGRLLKVNGVEFAQARLIGTPGTGAPQLSVKVKRTEEIFEGPEALALAGRLLPAINVAGGAKRTVEEAVRDLDAQHGSEAYLERYFTSVGPVDRKGRPKPVSTLPAPTRLALEMALHEEAERRAIEGELAVLEAAWAEAEEIAGISDNMLLPASVETKLEELKRPAVLTPRESPDA